MTSPFDRSFQIAIHAFGPVKCVSQLELCRYIALNREGLELGGEGLGVGLGTGCSVGSSGAALGDGDGRGVGAGAGFADGGVVGL